MGTAYLSAGDALLAWLEGRGFQSVAALLAVYVPVVLLCIGVSVLCHELALAHRLPPLGRALVLGAAILALVGLRLAAWLATLRRRWWGPSGRSPVSRLCLGFVATQSWSCIYAAWPSAPCPRCPRCHAAVCRWSHYPRPSLAWRRW